METLMQFISEHSQSSILVIIVLIMILTISWLALGFMGGKAEATESQINLDALREMKNELRSRELEIDQLKQKISSPGQDQEGKARGSNVEIVEGSSSEESAALLLKVNELEERLSEYEIIEDDIADLSRFKEENEKLKIQIKELTGDVKVQQAKPPASEEPS